MQTTKHLSFCISETELRSITAMINFTRSSFSRGITQLDRVVVELSSPEPFVSGFVSGSDYIFIVGNQRLPLHCIYSGERWAQFETSIEAAALLAQ
jgi:hypothetical protein